MMPDALFNSCAQGSAFMSVIGLLVLAALALGVAALLKYLFRPAPGQRQPDRLNMHPHSAPRDES